MSPECTPGLRLFRTGPSEEASCSLKDIRLQSWNPSSYQESIWGGPLRVLCNVFRNFPGKMILHSESSVLLLSPLLLLFFFSPPFFLLGLILRIHWTAILMASSNGLMSLWHHPRSLSKLCWFACWAKENPLFLFAAPVLAFLCQDIG